MVPYPCFPCVYSVDRSCKEGSQFVRPCRCAACLTARSLKSGNINERRYIRGVKGSHRWRSKPNQPVSRPWPAHTMRFNGKLKKWNAERGFGFIAADQGGQDLFVHISSFERGIRPPMQGDELSFEVEPGRDGRKCAVRVQSLASAQLRSGMADRSAARPRSSTRSQPSVMSGLVTLCIVAALGWFGYAHYAARSMPEPVTDMSQAPAPAAMIEATAYRCDGRRYCSQMSSCKEAQFFLKNCPATKMDGDHDGVPCEEQWCTGSLAD